MRLNEVLDVIFRWAHLIAGIMWIGNSMLFNWLDRNLEKSAALGRLSQGKIYMVHSGAFYEAEKKLLEPGEMPENLHWFKWQNFTTWSTGIALLVVVYYMNDAAFLVDPSVAQLNKWVAISLSLGALICGWLVYDGVWTTFGEANPKQATVLSIVLLFGAVFGFSQVFSGRAAYILTGVLIGTLMTGNVWFTIVPSQRSLIAATLSGKEQDPVLSLRAKQRSIHNNYFTFPLLFIMVSNHFQAAYTHHLNWLILIAVMVGGAGIRHFMNHHYVGDGSVRPTSVWLGPAFGMAGIALAGLLVITRMGGSPPPKLDRAVPFARAQEIIEKRCVPCHAESPRDPTWPVAPAGVKLETPQQIEIMSQLIYQHAVRTNRMPLNNKTLMTVEERSELASWIEHGAKIE